jgi:hypothetical protein
VVELDTPVLSSVCFSLRRKGGTESSDMVCPVASDLGFRLK